MAELGENVRCRLCGDSYDVADLLYTYYPCDRDPNYLSPTDRIDNCPLCTPALWRTGRAVDLWLGGNDRFTTNPLVKQVAMGQPCNCNRCSGERP